MRSAPEVYSAPPCPRCRKRHKGATCAPAASGPELASLTGRQRQVVQLLCEARSNGDIAKQMGISEETVKLHLNRVYDAFGLGSRLEIVVRFLPLLRKDAMDAADADRDAMQKQVSALEAELARERRINERLLGSPSPVSSSPRVRGAPARTF
jgi:DNA-binding CsgD family transcriptional regulator